MTADPGNQNQGLPASSSSPLDPPPQDCCRLLEGAAGFLLWIKTREVLGSDFVSIKNKILSAGCSL